MIRTENQARLTGCCGPVGTGQLQGVIRLCVASACMGWREVEPGVPDKKDENNNLIKGKPSRGYCGVAGPPAEVVEVVA